jgi:hypothetical protein
MRAKSFEETLRHTPFRPFEINADGRAIPVDRPEQVWITSDKSTIVVGTRDGGFTIVDMDHISSLCVRVRPRKTPPKAAS